MASASSSPSTHGESSSPGPFATPVRRRSSSGNDSNPSPSRSPSSSPPFAPGPTAVVQLSHGHFCLTLTGTTTFPPTAVLPSIYALLPQSQLTIDHMDVQSDDSTRRLRVQLVGRQPQHAPHALSNLRTRLKTVQPGASVTVWKDVSQLRIDNESVAAICSMLHSSSSRAQLDPYLLYYRLHAHESFEAQLLLYIHAGKADALLDVMRRFMADPIGSGAVRPPRPSGLEVKADTATTTAPAAATAAAVPMAQTQPTTNDGRTTASGASVAPEKTGVLLNHRQVSPSSRSPHFKPRTVGLPPVPIESSPVATMNPLLVTPTSDPPATVTVTPLPSTTGTPPTELAPVCSDTRPAVASSHATVCSVGPALAATATETTASTTSGSTSSNSHPSTTSSTPTDDVTSLSPLPLANKWWRRHRADLLQLVSQHALNHDSLYVYSLEALRQNIANLKSIKSINRVFYAMKANNFVPFLREVERQGVGFECVSIHELRTIRSLFPDLARDRLLFTPNFAPKIEYAESYTYTDFVTLDNTFPLHHWPEVFRGKTILIRVDPGEGLGHHAHVQTGGARSKFGVSVTQLKEALPLIAQLNIKVIGLHVHKGSGIDDPTVWATTASFLSSFLRHFPHLRFLDLGGGLGVQYKVSDNELDLAQVDANIASFKQNVLLAESMPSHAKTLELWLEPGRYIAANIGVLLGTVTQLKSKPGRDFIGISTGINSLIRPALYESYHEIINLSQLDDVRDAHQLNRNDPDRFYLVDVVGPICETGDVLGHRRSMPRATTEGDVVLVDTAGAYGRVMSSHYNMREPAMEVVLEQE